jgi:hypothetical protein
VATRLYIAAAAGAAVFICVLQTDLTFWTDEWSFLILRDGFGADALLEPHNDHIVVAPAAIYRVLVELFGLDSPRPFQLVGVALHITATTLVFVYVRRRCGEWLALAAALPLLVLGSSWLNLLFPFQIAFTGALACGVGALLALDRDDRRGDVIACALLVLGVLFNALILAFTVAVAVIVGARPDRLRRAWVVAIPVAVFGLWWLAYGREAETAVTLSQVLTSPQYIVDGIASSISSLLGFTGSQTGDGADESALGWGRALLVVIIVLAAWRLRGRGRPSWWLIAAVAGLLALWFLLGANRAELRPPESGRYQYLGVVLLILVLAELLRGVRPCPRVVAGAMAVGALAAVANLVALHEGSEQGMKPIAEYTRGALAAVELAADQVDPELELDSGVEISPFYGLTAGSYLAGVGEHGSPAYPPAELAAAPERSRAAADQTSATALGIELAPATDRPQACRTIDASAGAAAKLPPGGATVRAPNGEIVLNLRRYATESFPVALGTAKPGASTITIPPDAGPQTWELQLLGAEPVAICRTAG